jgi:hypothetical protein
MKLSVFMLIRAGNGGLGGSGPNYESPHGRTGKPGSNGAFSAHRLGFDGRITDLDVDRVFAFPEQCQMLLDKADRLYFTNRTSEIVEATALYSTIIRRLSFVPGILATKSEPPLLKAYKSIDALYEPISSLTVSSLTQLDFIRVQALNRSNRISLGEDMFGHANSWAPRLSVNFYSDSVNNQLKFLQNLEDAQAEYNEALSKQSDASNALNALRLSNKQAEDASKERIDLYTRPSGGLDECSQKIRSFIPLMEKNRQSIKAAIARVQWDIENEINLDPQTLLDAFATFAEEPSAFSIASAVAKATLDTYDAMSTIEDNQGQKYEKSWVISELGTCGDTLQSLHEAVKARKDGAFDLTDPGALKLITTSVNIKTLVSKFKDAIPNADKEEMSNALDRYIEVVIERNDAIVAYNSVLQLLAEALSDQTYYHKAIDEIGEKLLKIDQTLPAIYYWISRVINSVRLDVMQRLNYEARAITFWGLSRSTSFTEPGPLLGYLDLARNQNELEKKFEDCVSNFSHSLWSIWPKETSDQGLYYQLSDAELEALKQPNPDSDGSKFYEVFVSFSETSPLFFNMANIRLSQFRVWIIGATCDKNQGGKQMLTIDIQHMGKEKVISPASTIFSFDHDAAAFQFKYDATDIKDIHDCQWKRVFSTESIEQDFSGGEVSKNTYAPLGPLVVWRVVVRENGNPGLSLKRISKAYLEFCGRSMSFL